MAVGRWGVSGEIGGGDCGGGEVGGGDWGGGEVGGGDCGGGEVGGGDCGDGEMEGGDCGGALRVGLLGDRSGGTGERDPEKGDEEGRLAAAALLHTAELLEAA